MKNNLRRHRLLEILKDKYFNQIQPGEKVIGVSWDDLMTKLNCTLDKLIEISSPLYDEKEIDNYDAYGVKGVFIKMKGVSSYTTEKYKRENTRLIFEAAKNWVQTIIPLLSLLIAIYALIISENRIKIRDNEIIKFKIRIEELESEVIDIDKRIQPKSDSLN